MVAASLSTPTAPAGATPDGWIAALLAATTGTTAPWPAG